jgi:hypothetical protein
VKSRRTRSSWTGGPAYLTLPRFFPKTLHQRLPRQIHHSVRSAHCGPRTAGFIGQEAIAELRILTMGIEQRVLRD